MEQKIFNVSEVNQYLKSLLGLRPAAGGADGAGRDQQLQGSIPRDITIFR